MPTDPTDSSDGKRRCCRLIRSVSYFVNLVELLS
jgi:hypothetical protein